MQYLVRVAALALAAATSGCTVITVAGAAVDVVLPSGDDKK